MELSGDERTANESTTEHLLARASEGTRTAAGNVIEHYDDVLISCVRRHLGTKRFAVEGEDLLQEIRVAVAGALPTVREPKSPAFRAFVKKVVRSQVLDWEKRKQSRRRNPGAPMLRLGGTRVPELESEQPTPSQECLKKEEIQRLEVAIEKTKQRYRELLRWLFRSSPDLGEIARFLGKEPEAARKFTARALEDLKRAFRATPQG